MVFQNLFGQILSVLTTHMQNQKPHKTKGYKETSEGIRYAYDLDSGDRFKGACMFLNLPNRTH